MIVVDTNLLSTFARIQRLDLLFAVAETDALYLTPAVKKEIELGLKQNLDFLLPVSEGLANGTKFFLLQLTPDEKHLSDTLPASLNAGEKESISVCQKRPGSKLLTNDKRAHNYCQENQIASLDLKLVLRRLWKAGHCTKEEVRFIMDEIEAKEPGMVIKGKEEILR